MKKILAILLTVVIALSLSTVAFAALPVDGSPAKEIVIDGAVSAEEWGAPAYSGDLDLIGALNYNGYVFDCENGWMGDWGAPDNQSYDIFATKDSEYAYVAVRINNSGAPIYATDNALASWKTNLTLTIGAYDPVTVTKYANDGLGTTNDEFSCIRIGERLDGTDLIEQSAVVSAWATKGAVADIPLAAENFSINYDAEANTYTYELRVPLADTNIAADDTEFVLSCDFYTATKNGLGHVHYILGGSSAIAYDTDWNNTPATSVHRDATRFDKVVHPFVVSCTVEEPKVIETKVGDKASKFSGKIDLDGSVSEAEWGEPVIVTTPEHCQETWGNFWTFDLPAVVKDQVAKIYITNDSEYLYVAATLDECDYDDSCTDIGNVWKAAHFSFSVSGYDEEYTVKRIPFEGKEYEQYTGFMMGLVNGKKANYAFTQGHVAENLLDEDYAIKYDEATRTYTYEVRVPFSKMNVTSDKIAFSANIGTPYSGLSDGTNRYNITTGATTFGGPENWAHLNNALCITLLTNPETGDMNVFMVVAVASMATLGCGVVLALKKRIVVK